MRRVILVPLSFSLLLLAAPARAVDAKGAIACAMVDVFDCSSGECVEVTSESVGVPDLLRIDPEKKTATALDTEFQGSKSPLDSVTTEGSNIVARGRQGERSLVLTVETATGDGIATVTDPKTTLVMYAECVDL